MPEISIIVPVYRAEAYLHGCIDSILGQSFQDFEVILVDDGSPDRSGEICEAYAAKDSRIRVLHQENQGQSAARNHALEIARGRLLCFVDSDDWIHPQTLALLYGALGEGKASISMCRMLEAEALPEDFAVPREANFQTLRMDETTLADMFDRGEYPGWVACAKLIPREIVEGYPFQPGRVYEDNEAVCHWLLAGKTLAVTEEALYFYRTNPGSTTQRGFSLKKLDYLWALERIMRFYREAGYEAMTARFSALYAIEAADCYRWVRNDHPQAAKDIRRTTRQLYRREGFPLEKPQFEALLDAMHPRLVRLYWPLEAAARTVREQGLGGLVRKAAAGLKKGDEE